MPPYHNLPEGLKIELHDIYTRLREQHFSGHRQFPEVEANIEGFIRQNACRLKRVAEEDWSSKDIRDRLKTDLPNLLSCPPPPRELLDKFRDIEEVRHNIMHPKPSNMFGSGVNWDKIPLAWLLSERRGDCFSTAISLLEHFEPYYIAFKKKFKGRTTLTFERGQEFTQSAKKVF